jgi:hypothetical protein
MFCATGITVKIRTAAGERRDTRPQREHRRALIARWSRTVLTFLPVFVTPFR